MRLFVIALLLFIPISMIGQSRIDTLFAIADNHFENKEYDEAKLKYENLKLEVERGSNDYSYAADQIAMIYFYQKDDLRTDEKYIQSIEYLKEFIEYLEKENENIRPFWNNEKRYFLIKTIIQNYFSLGEYAKAKEYQQILYEAYDKKQLPEGINEYYSFDMFKWKDKNVWGYEWFPKLGDPETEGSFSKIIYYIFNTDENGQDKDQLFRLHVLKVHKIDSKQPDYVLTKRLEKAEEQSGTLWSYTYNEPIDYEKLKSDIENVLKGNYESEEFKKYLKKGKN